MPTSPPPIISSSAPIGVFDSGVGGLTILREIRAALPREDLLYIADAGHLPYGDKPLEFVRDRAFVLADFLLGRGAKAIVVACNTATAAAIEALREAHAVPFVGVEPGVKPAAAATRSGVIGVLATPAMLKSVRYASLVARFAQGKQVIEQPCAGLADHIEQGRLDDAATEALVHGFVAPLLAARADTIVLGCTHYPLIAHIVRRLAGPAVQVLENGTAVAQELARQLASRSALRPEGEGGTAFWTSGRVEEVAPAIGRLWGPAQVERLPESVEGFSAARG